MKHPIILLAAACATAVLQTAANAATCTWRAGSTGGWNDPASWDGGVPGASDTVAVPNGVELPVNDADAALAGSVAEVVLGEGSRIVFNLAATDCSMSGTITGGGTIVKNGADTTVHLLSTDDDAYKTTGGMRVNAGTLECPQTFASSYSSVRFNIGPLHVEEGATFKPYARYRTTEVTSLTGGGRILQSTSGGYWPFRISNINRSTFSGTIGGYLELNINGKIDMTSVSNSFSGGIYLNDRADLGIAKFGNRDDNYSSLGMWYTSGGVRYYRDIAFANTSTLRYLGMGETSNKHIKLGNKNVAARATIDAGATGGLTLSGKIYQSEDSAFQSVLTLTGSNTTVSAVSGVWEDHGTNSTYLAKSGTGTWLLTHNANRRLSGVVGIEEGTLKFDTLTETNVPCSFGLSTLLAQKYTGDWDASKTADYAILLGSADAEGTLEYIGTNLWDNAAATRPVAVTGRGGRIVSSVAGRRIGLKGAFAADSAGGTLTLDGAGTTNYLYGAVDGHGPLSIAKEGTGTWVLAGDQTFGGKLDVKGGELIVSSTLGTKYSWYRMTVKRTVGIAVGDSSQRQLRMNEIGLFDASGTRLNLGLVKCGANTLPDIGQACHWRTTYNTWVGNLFDQNLSTSAGENKVFSVNLSQIPMIDEPDTWVQIVMRLPDATPEAVSYDICSNLASGNSWEPNAWTMEASADGVFWDTVANVTSNELVYASQHWISDNSAFTKNARHISPNPDFVFGLDKGKSLLSGAPSQLANATVSVAEGAVLRAEGSVALSSVEVDASRSGGTIDGFAFAAGGTLNVVGAATPSEGFALPVAIVHESGTENLSGWTVNMNGRRTGRRVSCSDGQLVLSILGTAIVIR